MAASTNLDNLGSHPVRALAASAVLSENDAAAWVVLAAVGLAGLVAAVGPVRAVAVALAAHLIGTAVSEGTLAIRISRGLEPPAARSIVDVGPSFVIVGVLIATLVVARGRVWRVVAALGFGVLAPSLFEGLTQWDVAAVGHVAAVAVGRPAAPCCSPGRAGAGGAPAGFDASTQPGLAGGDTPRRRP